jgi:predicted metalloendopeptidase
MSNEQAIATYISASFHAFSDNQKQTNTHLENIHKDLQDVKKILGEHDTRLTIHQKDIDNLGEGAKLVNDDILNIKKKMFYLVAGSAASVTLSSASILKSAGVKVPVLDFLLKLLA